MQQISIYIFQFTIRNAYDPAALNPIPMHRDSASPRTDRSTSRPHVWRRDENLRVESAVDAERFIEDVGFAKLRSLTPALSQWERAPYADRCPSRRSIVSDIAVC